MYYSDISDLQYSRMSGKKVNINLNHLIYIGAKPIKTSSFLLMLCGRQFHRDLTERRYAVTDITTMLCPQTASSTLGEVVKSSSKYKFTSK